MRTDFKSTSQAMQKCMIITSTSSLTCYEKFLPGLKLDTLLIYRCFHEENTENIPAADYYEIIIDFNNKDINNIAYKMLNRLLQFECGIHAKVLESSAAGDCMKLLKKLERNNLIRLEILKDNTKVNIKNLLESLPENIIGFIGPGNTGKTSIISSISELFCYNKQRVALVDLTIQHKLTNYFSCSINLSDICIDDTSINQYAFQLGNKHNNNTVNLYIYDKSADIAQSETVFLCKSIKYLSKHYDFVLINADENIVSNSVDIFKLCKKIFIVHDCMLTKTNQAHQILLNLNRSDVNTQERVSLIYNKMLRKASDIGMIEENLIFESNSKGHLIPLVDIRCNTLEILYNRQTMIALNNKIITKASTIYDASINYIKNISRLYKFINNLSYCEYTEMHFSEFIQHHVYNNIIRTYVLANIKHISKCFGKKKYILPEENVILN